MGANSHFVAVLADRSAQPVREFEAFTADLYRLADWLAQCGVETVVMESTGVYWIPLFGVLEERDFQVMLVDPRRIKNVPGRKTDVLDCQWLQQLHTTACCRGPSVPMGRSDAYVGGLADGGVQVNGQGPVAGSGAGLPGAGQKLAAHPVQLADMAPPEAAQERAQSLPSRKRGVEGALTVPPRVRAVPPVRSASASSMQSPLASAEAASVIILSPVLARPGAQPRPCLSVVRLDRALSTPIRCSHHADLGLRSLGPTVRRRLHHQRRRRTTPRTAALKCGL